jgi:Fe-S oxidoreductase
MTASSERTKEKLVFAPGCALMLYKPELAEKLLSILNLHLGGVELFLTCCQHDPQIKENTKVINVCPGCDKRFAKDYAGVSTLSLWEILAETDFFPFPDYHGQRMSIMDACPTRENEPVQNAIRILLEKMNITLAEPKHTRIKSTCCGDSFYGEIPVDLVKKQMAKRTSEMPEENVVVYCVSCAKAVFIGGKHPQYLIDLLFAEKTVPKTYEPDKWHTELKAYIEAH